MNVSRAQPIMRGMKENENVRTQLSAHNVQIVAIVEMILRHVPRPLPTPIILVARMLYNGLRSKV